MSNAPLVGVMLLRKLPYTFATAAKSTATGPGVVETLTETLIDCAIMPEVPVTVTVAGDVVLAAPDEAVNVRVAPLLPDAANAAVTPAGNPDAVSVTVPVKEPTGVMFICVLAVEPGTTLSAV